MKKIISLLSLIILSNNASSALITYNDMGIWNSNLSTIVNEDFSSASSNILLGDTPTVFEQLTLTSTTTGSYSSAQIKSGYNSSTLDINGFQNGDHVDVFLPQAVTGVGFNYYPGDATNDLLNVYINGLYVSSLQNSLFGPAQFFGVISDAGNTINSLSFASSNYGMYTEIDSIAWSIAPHSVPSPASLWLFVIGLIMLFGSKLKNEQKC